MIVSNYWDFRAVFSPGGALGLDGYPEWPALETQAAPAIITTWQTAFPVSMTVTGVSDSDDAVAGVDEWDWYLQQPCELTNPASAKLELLPWIASLPATRSGAVRLSLTAAGTSFLATQSAEKMSQLLLNCFLFIRNRSITQNFVWDLHRAAFAPGTY